jgi:hypothetical protein
MGRTPRNGILTSPRGKLRPGSRTTRGRRVRLRQCRWQTVGVTEADLPELDVARVRRWCQHRVPEHARSQVKVECDVTPRHLTMVECRPPWRQDMGAEWTRFPIQTWPPKTSRRQPAARRSRQVVYLHFSLACFERRGGAGRSPKRPAQAGLLGLAPLDEHLCRGQSAA